MKSASVFSRRGRPSGAQRQHGDQEWLDRHKVAYERPGIMPFGKHKDQPLTTVVRDELYYRWFKGTVYARMNPELAADLAAITSTVPRRHYHPRYRQGKPDGRRSHCRRAGHPGR
jgi:hypothetical protein